MEDLKMSNFLLLQEEEVLEDIDVLVQVQVV
jgi:hypothetical protein